MTIIIDDNGTVKITTNECWRCGTDKGLTIHHCIPQAFKPKRNIEIKLCNKCHNEIHNDNLNSIVGFINKSIRDAQSSAGRLHSGMKRMEEF